jgi:methylated-DNA-[protein]-cysteine S-methyltransferase
MSTRHAVVDTTMGPITIVASGAAITGLYFAQHIRRPSRETLGPRVPVQEDRLLVDARQQLIGYLDGSRRTFDLPLAAAGDAFQKSVWAIVSEIPFGQTTSYGAIAAEIGDRSLAQDVGQAVAANPLCIVVPCHRVVGANGALIGYAGGLTRKRSLLDLEEPAAASVGRLF